MPTNDEKRRVAEMLRKPDGPSLMVLMSVLGVGGDRVFDRLADLIEPSERACHYYDSETNRCGCYDTRLIDRDALLELVKELELGAQCFVGRKWPDVECERAGKHLADDYEMIARRIRKALGVQDG